MCTNVRNAVLRYAPLLCRSAPSAHQESLALDSLTNSEQQIDVFRETDGWDGTGVDCVAQSSMMDEPCRSVFCAMIKRLIYWLLGGGMEDCMFDFSFPKRLGVFGTTAGSFPGIRAGPDNKKSDGYCKEELFMGHVLWTITKGKPPLDDPILYTLAERLRKVVSIIFDSRRTIGN